MGESRELYVQCIAFRVAKCTIQVATGEARFLMYAWPNVNSKRTHCAMIEIQEKKFFTHKFLHSEKVNKFNCHCCNSMQAEIKHFTFKWCLTFRKWQWKRCWQTLADWVQISERQRVFRTLTRFVVAVLLVCLHY